MVRCLFKIKKYHRNSLLCYVFITRYSRYTLTIRIFKKGDKGCKQMKQVNAKL